MQARVVAQLADMARRVDAHRAEGVETVVDIAEHQQHLADSAQDACDRAEAYFESLLSAIKKECDCVMANIAAMQREAEELLDADASKTARAVQACNDSAAAVAAASQSLDVGDPENYRAAMAALQGGEAVTVQQWDHAYGRAGAAWACVHVQTNAPAVISILRTVPGVTVTAIPKSQPKA